MTARLVFAALLLAFLGACGREPRQAESVLLVTLDTTRADHIGCYGYAKAETPVLDAFAKRATLFEDAVSAVPVTLPSHATMFTGLNPYGHGVRYNGSYILSASQTTLAERLKDAGFATGAVASSFAVAGHFGLNQGFETYEDLFAGPEGLKKGLKAERRADDAVDRAIEWWNGHRGGRRFLWVHLYDPHWGYHPPFPFSVKFRDRPYDGEIAYADRELGRLFQDLKKAGEWDRTLIVVAGDHGEGLYDHRERWHSTLVYEGTLHVPLLIKRPGQRAPVRVKEPVGLVDLAPTVLDFAGLPVPEEMEGIPLRRATKTGTAPLRPIYFEALAGNLNYGWAPLYGVRRGEYKVIRGGRTELYDLKDDPGELNDLSGSESERVADLSADLDRFLGAGAKSDATARAADLDDETMARLASLGYVGGSASTSSPKGRTVHPPDVIQLEQELLRALTAIGEKKWDEADEALDYILRQDPTNRFALTNRARGFMRAEKWASARTTAEALVGIYPDWSHGWDLLGEILARSGKPGEAAKVYAGALEKNPGNQRLRFHRFLALVEARNLPEAEEEVREMESRRPDHYTTALARARLEALQERPSAALEALRRAVDLGLSSLAVVESHDEFRAVRAMPGYRELKERMEKKAAGD